MCMKKQSDGIGISVGLKLIKSLSCMAAKCLDMRQVLCSIDIKPFHTIWERMVDLCGIHVANT